MSYQDLKCTVVECFQENNVEILQNIFKCLDKRFDDLLINKGDSPDDIHIDNNVHKQWGPAVEGHRHVKFPQLKEKQL